MKKIIILLMMCMMIMTVASVKLELNDEEIPVIKFNKKVERTDFAYLGVAQNWSAIQQFNDVVIVNQTVLNTTTINTSTICLNGVCMSDWDNIGNDTLQDVVSRDKLLTTSIQVSDTGALFFGNGNEWDMFIQQPSGNLIIDKNSGSGVVVIEGISLAGDLINADNITADRYFGDGSQLTGIISDINGTDINVTSVSITDKLNITYNGSHNTINTTGTDIYFYMGDSASAGATTYFIKGDDVVETPISQDAFALSVIDDTSRLRGAYYLVKGTANGFPPPANTVQGLNVFAQTNGSAHWQSVTGGIYGANINSADSGQVNAAYGIQGQVSANPTGATTITKVSPIFANTYNLPDADATITTWNQIEIGSLAKSAGTITTANGLKINAITGGTTNYGIFDDSGAGIAIDSDTTGLTFGEGQDSNILYDGTNTIISNLVGSGNLTIEMSVNVTDNLTGNLIYGEIYFHNDSSGGAISIIDSSATYYNVTGFNQTLESGNKLNGFTVVNNEGLGVLVDGLYKLDYSISFERASGGVSREFKIVIAVNDVIQDNTEVHRSTSNVNDVGNAGATGFIQLSKDDYVTMQIQNVVGTENAGVHAANFNLVRIGD